MFAEFRYYLSQNYPFILEGYYKLGEKLGGETNIRQIDSAYWIAEGKTNI